MTKVVCSLTCRVFQQQFCQIGKPVVVRGIQPGFFWDPDTLQRATLSLKGMYGKRANKSAPKRMIKAPTPLTVSFALLPALQSSCCCCCCCCCC